jgi:hypothetical protein
VTAQGPPYARFRRALAAGDLFLIRAAAAEVPQIPLGDALAICLRLCGFDPDSYERASSVGSGASASSGPRSRSRT